MENDLASWLDNPTLKCGEDIIHLIGLEEAERVLKAAVDEGLLIPIGRSQLAMTHHPEGLYVHAIYKNR